MAYSYRLVGIGLEASTRRVEGGVMKSAQEYEEICNVALNRLKLEEQYGILNFCQVNFVNISLHELCL
jgi:hypothetical protein